MKSKIRILGNYMPSGYNTGNIYQVEGGVLPTVMCNHNTSLTIKHRLGIRRITPRECYRLMGFDDKDFDAAAKVCNETQLFKQAGNSIVVKVLEHILTNVFINKKEYEETLVDMIEKSNANK